MAMSGGAAECCQVGGLWGGVGGGAGEDGDGYLGLEDAGEAGPNFQKNMGDFFLSQHALM